MYNDYMYFLPRLILIIYDPLQNGVTSSELPKSPKN